MLSQKQVTEELVNTRDRFEACLKKAILHGLPTIAIHCLEQSIRGMNSTLNDVCDGDELAIAETAEAITKRIGWFA